MKKIIVGFCILFLMGCATMQPTPIWNTPCAIYEDFGATAENSIIA
jgi:hypothetical protein